jgi:hypothetical protein
MKTKAGLLLGLVLAALPAWATVDDLERAFATPPPSAKPWVFWFWINGNISREGITADLEAMKQAGIGGALWMEVSGPWWAPDGRVRALSPEWHDCMQWAVREFDRLGMEFDLSVDFGYGSGGPHISPTNSMQKLYWSETEVEGGRPVDLVLAKPQVDRGNVAAAWLRPGAEIDPRVRATIETMDSYRDVAVLAIPAPASPAGRAYRIPELNQKDGTGFGLPKGLKAPPLPADAVTPADRVVDLTGRMGSDGRLAWDAPPGRWLVLRCGHASNFKMTRPSPQAAVGLECDRLSKAGIDAHYGAFLKPIFDGAGAAAGRALTHVHIDSWEAGGQNWTASFPAEFRARRGYDLRPWLPVLAGRVVGSAALSERFLWDMRATVSEMIRDNYAGRLRELAQRHRMKLSIEAYGHLCIDNLSYAGVCDFPISEFWARGTNTFPDLLAGRGGYAPSTKAMASAAHTYGKPVIGAEAWTSDRGWRDHPYLMKAMGDEMYCRGLNRVIFHLSAHQAYDTMVPGLTHRKWGEHIQRHNTWWGYSRPWMDYLARCQHLLQQGDFVADVAYWFGEGAPLGVDHMKLDLPAGYDFDFCSSENVLQMGVRDGRLVLPSGASYRYLLLPATDRMTLPLARKVQGLVAAGARVIGGPRPAGTPGLTGFPGCDAELEAIAAALWDKGLVTTGATPAEVFARDRLPPDFEGGGLRHVHRRAGGADVYFVSHQQEGPLDTTCTFRLAGKRPELWDPESGAIRALPEFTERDGRISVPLRFDPMQSWFVVFRGEGRGTRREGRAARGNFPTFTNTLEIAGPWEVSFDPKWGGPDKPVAFDSLTDWSRHADPRIQYFSGTATYRKVFDLPTEIGGRKSEVGSGHPSAADLRPLASDLARPSSLVPRLFLDLGSVEVMARVRVNGKDCGIAWKPPYRVDITAAVREGANELEIDVVNLWINRMIGDEQLPLDGNWKDFETLLEWPEWFLKGTPRPSGRFTFTSCRHYTKDTPLVPSGLLGPVILEAMEMQP